MIDNGFPLTTEPNILQEMIAPPNLVSKVLSVVTGSSSNVSDTLPGATASCVPWRTADPKYANNEVYVDLVEELDATINRSICSNMPVLVFHFLGLIILWVTHLFIFKLWSYLLVILVRLVKLDFKL